MITVTGAAMVFSTLPNASAGRRRSLPPQAARARHRPPRTRSSPARGARSARAPTERILARTPHRAGSGRLGRPPRRTRPRRRARRRSAAAPGRGNPMSRDSSRSCDVYCPARGRVAAPRLALGRGPTEAKTPERSPVRRWPSGVTRNPIFWAPCGRPPESRL